MARTDLASLLGKIDTDDVATPTAAAQDVPAPTTSTEPSPSKRSTRTRVGAEAKSRRVTTPRQAEPATSQAAQNRVSYLEFVRKETRLREDQYETLTDYARKLNRAKSMPGGERITENTLIRIAIDLLLPHLDQLAGDDESALRKSVTNRV